MIIKKAVYDYGFALAKQYVDKNLPEIAIAGKSNVGKSSFINMLCNNGKLSRVGQKPGKTILINAFKVNDSFYLMDFPGYGFAKVSDKEKARWAELMEGYLCISRQLKCVVLLVDIRHSVSEGDKQMLKWLTYYQIPFIVCATKADKLSASQTQKALKTLSVETGIIINQIIPVSSVTRKGKEETLNRIEELLSIDTEALQ
jgi:GTP-binding protein